MYSMCLEIQPKAAVLLTVSIVLQYSAIVSPQDVDELMADLRGKLSYFDSKIEKLMRMVDRKDFSTRAKNPYKDEVQDIGWGATIDAPNQHASIINFLKRYISDKEGMKILEIGFGSGYLTVCMALMVGKNSTVYGIEHFAQVKQLAEDNIRKEHADLLTSRKIRLFFGDGRKGLPQEGPFDVIFVGAAIDAVPLNLLQQLVSGGSLFVPNYYNWKKYTKREDGRFDSSVVGVSWSCYANLTDAEEQYDDNYHARNFQGSYFSLRNREWANRHSSVSKPYNTLVKVINGTELTIRNFRKPSFFGSNPDMVLHTNRRGTRLTLQNFKHIVRDPTPRTRNDFRRMDYDYDQGKDYDNNQAKEYYDNQRTDFGTNRRGYYDSIQWRYRQRKRRYYENERRYYVDIHTEYFGNNERQYYHDRRVDDANNQNEDYDNNQREDDDNNQNEDYDNNQTEDDDNNQTEDYDNNQREDDNNQREDYDNNQSEDDHNNQREDDNKREDYDNNQREDDRNNQREDYDNNQREDDNKREDHDNNQREHIDKNEIEDFENNEIEDDDGNQSDDLILGKNYGKNKRKYNNMQKRKYHDKKKRSKSGNKQRKKRRN